MKVELDIPRSRNKRTIHTLIPGTIFKHQDCVYVYLTNYRGRHLALRDTEDHGDNIAIFSSSFDAVVQVLGVVDVLVIKGKHI